MLYILVSGYKESTFSGLFASSSATGSEGCHSGSQNPWRDQSLLAATTEVERTCGQRDVCGSLLNHHRTRPFHEADRESGSEQIYWWINLHCAERFGAWPCLRCQGEGVGDGEGQIEREREGGWEKESKRVRETETDRKEMWEMDRHRDRHRERGRARDREGGLKCRLF